MYLMPYSCHFTLWFLPHVFVRVPLEVCLRGELQPASSCPVATPCALQNRVESAQCGSCVEYYSPGGQFGSDVCAQCTFSWLFAFPLRTCCGSMGELLLLILVIYGHVRGTVASCPYPIFAPLFFIQGHQEDNRKWLY